MNDIKKKTRIVWICHFTNEEIQSFLPLRKQKDEMAPWIPNTVKGFENREDVELHIVSPHANLKRTTKVTIRNIHYYFIPYGIPIWHRHWPRFFRFDVYSNFYFFRKKVKKIVNGIKPDIVNLIGAENAYYSSSVLNLKNDYPVLISIQGFVRQHKEFGEIVSLDAKKRIDVEETILKTFKYFCGEQDSSNYLLPFNPNHVFFRLYFPVNEELVSITKDKQKKYDCIYFGTLAKIKGAEDFIKVIAEIKIKKSNVKGCIIGRGDINRLKELAKELNCENDIEFIGFVKSQKELFEYVKSSKVFLSPPYKERLSSTIREAMLLKVPIVAYATGGIPYINEYDEHIYLVETGDYKEMALKTFLLLKNEQLRNQLAEKAYNYAVNEYSIKSNNERLMTAYQTILDER